MPNYIIAYDIDEEEGRVASAEVIKTLKRWDARHVQRSVWLLENSQRMTKDIADELRALLDADADDRLIVAPYSGIININPLPPSV